MYTVIIADDEPWVAYGIAKLIDWEALGFHIIDTVLDGPSALEKVKQNRPDLLISDIRMPGLNGLELMRCIREARIDTEVVFISGYTEFEYAQEAVRLGAFDYLVKQVEDTDLQETLVRVARRLSEKKAEDWDTYFTLFDESARLTVDECMKMLGAEQPVPACQFISLLFNGPVDKPLIAKAQLGGARMFAFRTGTNKLGVLVYGENLSGAADAVQTQYPNAVAFGSGKLSGGSDSFYLLYRQSDIAARAARRRTMRKAPQDGEAEACAPLSADTACASQTQRIIAELDADFRKDIRITDLAKELYISPNYLCTLVKRETGMTFSDYIINKRITAAKALLRETDLSIQEIIEQIGYKDYAHFNKLFKRRVGITPSKYRTHESV